MIISGKDAINYEIVPYPVGLRYADPTYVSVLRVMRLFQRRALDQNQRAIKSATVTVRSIVR